MKRTNTGRSPLFVRILCIVLAVLMLSGAAYLTLSFLFSALAL